MTKAETKRITTAMHVARMSRKTKTPDYRERTGIFLMGHIQAMRDIVKLFRPGNEKAQVFADYAELRASYLVKQLRKL